MEIRKICLGHGKVAEFQIFANIGFSKEVQGTLCEASKRSASGLQQLSILRSWNLIQSQGKFMEFSI